MKNKKLEAEKSPKKTGYELSSSEKRKLMMDQYLEGTNIHDLENMSKWRTPKNIFKSTGATNAIHPNGI